MKRFFASLVTILALSAASAGAQEQPFYGPQKGDLAISIGAGNIFNLAGDAYNGVRYALTDRVVLDAGVKLNIIKGSGDNDYNNILYELVADDTESQTVNFQLSALYLLTPGKRIQTFVGGGLYTYLYNSVNKYTQHYDNGDLTAEDEGYRAPNTEFSHSQTKRLGVMVVAGIECYITPKLSISGMLDAGVAWGKNVQLNETTTNGETTTNRHTKSNTFSAEICRLDGHVAINYYF